MLHADLIVTFLTDRYQNNINGVIGKDTFRTINWFTVHPLQYSNFLQH